MITEDKYMVLNTRTKNKWPQIIILETEPVMSLGLD